MGKTTLVILAAGKGTRFLPLTQTTPKPLLKIGNIPAIQYSIEAALPYITEIVFVVGFLATKFKEHFGEEFKGVPVKYIEQIEQLGTAHAVYSVKDFVQADNFLLLYGDDLYEQEIISKLFEYDKGTLKASLKGDLSSSAYNSKAVESSAYNAILGKKEENWQSFGVLQKTSDGFLDQIIEKPQGFVGDLVNIGAYLLSKDIFNYFEKIEKSVRGEFEFTDMVSLYAKDQKIKVVECDKGWTPLSYPWHLLSANEAKLKDIEENIEGEIETGATIKGILRLGKGSVIKSGAYLEGNFVIGENCIIGPNCSLKYFASIGDGCVIGNGVEIARSVIGDEVDIKHLSYIGDSILGNKVNIGAGTIIANLRHDNSPVKMNINDNFVDSGRRKLGAVLGDQVKTGINTSIYPGIKLNVGVTTLPGEIITKDRN